MFQVAKDPALRVLGRVSGEFWAFASREHLLTEMSLLL